MFLAIAQNAVGLVETIVTFYEVVLVVGRLFNALLVELGRVPYSLAIMA